MSLRAELDMLIERVEHALRFVDEHQGELQAALRVLKARREGLVRGRPNVRYR